LIDQEAPVTRAIVIHPVSRDVQDRSSARLEEAAGLAEALDLEVIEAMVTPLRKIEAGRYFGRGKVEELGVLIHACDANVAVVDANLSPVQQRNLETDWKVKVIDRTGLILEIFGRRAQTKEGVLQVELARLAYERSRLVRTWTHLERQRGGGGVMSGPGETQIETDRRLLADKMAKLRRQLDEVRRTRSLHRNKRQDVPYPTVALVGYTNTGKSTLFNRLTGAKVLAKDMPFATLDPTVRGIKLPKGTQILLSDTVGFITELPTELIAAFRATLEEVREADVLVHVVDASDPDRDGRIRDVEEVLDALEAGPSHDQATIEAWNKLDALTADERVKVDAVIAARGDSLQARNRLLISALKASGLEVLTSAVETALTADHELLNLAIPPQDGRAVAWLHRHGEALQEETDPETGILRGKFKLTEIDMGRFRSEFPSLANQLPELPDPDEY
jgi:GTP-binding protein HflX